MFRSLLLAIALFSGVSAAWAQQKVIVFVDGTRMEIQSYAVKGGVVQFETMEGRLQSVPRSYVNLVATEQINSGGAPAPATPKPPPPAPAPAPAAPAPSPAPTAEPMRTEPITAEPDLVDPEPAAPPAPAAAPAPSDQMGAPPPVWSNDELQVSLVVPSSSWRLQDLPPSFDVAVSLENPTTEARATLALIRQELRSEKDFRNVVQDVETSVSQAPGFRSLTNEPLMLEPYTAHELEFVKSVGFVPVYNRIIVVYSRDLAYVLSLTCAEARLEENRADFETLVRGLVIRKTRADLTP